MAVCLRCDQCGATCAEKDDEMAAWWRLERQPIAFVSEPGRSIVPSHLYSVATVAAGDLDEEDFEELEEEELQEVIRAMAIDVILHFCSSECLGHWGTQASNLEG